MNIVTKAKKLAAHAGSLDRPSDKQFGLVFGVLFCAAYIVCSYLGYSSLHILWVLGAVFLFLARVAPRYLGIPNIIWSCFGLVIGYCVSFVVLSLIYFFVLIPSGVIRNIFFQSDFKKKFDRSLNSYWVARQHDIESMTEQF